jgi:WD40 repeat protein
VIRVWDVRKLQKVPVRQLSLFFIGPPMRVYDLRSHSSEQVQRNGVLELELQDVAQLDKPKGGTATLRADCKHDKAVTSASWDPRGRSVVSTCYDDALRCMFLYDRMRSCSPFLHGDSHSLGRLSVIHDERCAVPPFQAALSSWA